MAEMKDVLKELEERMGKTVQYMQDEFATIRAGRANPHVLDRLTVDYYGSATPIQQVGNISVPEARMIVIQPWDKSLLKAIEKAIQKSDLGINPKTLNDWVIKKRGTGRVSQARDEAQVEADRLKRENAELREQVEFLKKAAAFFARTQA